MNIQRIERYEKTRIGIKVLVRISEPCQNNQAIQRHPKQVGVNEVFLDLGSSGQIDESMVTLTKRRHWLSDIRLEWIDNRLPAELGGLRHETLRSSPWRGRWG